MNEEAWREVRSQYRKLKQLIVDDEELTIHAALHRIVLELGDAMLSLEARESD